MFLGTKCVPGLPGCYRNHCDKVFKVHIWNKCSLWLYILIDNLVAMETLLPWQQVNYAITQLYVSILSP